VTESRVRAVLLVLFASLLFGTTGTAQALGPADVDVVSVGAARIVFGGGVLALIAGALRWRGAAPSRIELPLAKTRSVLLVVIGALGVIAYQPAFFLGTSTNGVAVGTLVALGSAPVMTGALAWILERRFPGVRWAVATVIAAVGVVMLGASTGGGEVGNSSAEGMDPVGLAGSLGAGLSYAVYTLASKRLLQAGWVPASTMGAVFGGAAILGVVVLLTTDNAWLATPAGVVMALWLGLATVTVAYLLFARGLQALSAPIVATVTLAEPLTASILGVVVLQEQLSPVSWLGVAVIALGILVLIVRPQRTLPG